MHSVARSLYTRVPALPRDLGCTPGIQHRAVYPDGQIASPYAGGVVVQPVADAIGLFHFMP